MKSKKQLKTGENIKRIMSNIFLREDLAMIDGSLITILEADISPDCSSVKIFIDILGNPENEKKILKKLKDLTPNLRYKLAGEALLRITPQISFICDKTSEHVSKISALIDNEADFYNHKLLSKTASNQEISGPKARKKKS